MFAKEKDGWQLTVIETEPYSIKSQPLKWQASQNMRVFCFTLLPLQPYAQYVMLQSRVLELCKKMKFFNNLNTMQCLLNYIFPGFSVDFLQYFCSLLFLIYVKICNGEGMQSFHLKTRNGKSVIWWNMGKEYSVLGQFVLDSEMMQVLSWLLSIQHFLLWLIIVLVVVGTSTGFFLSPWKFSSFSRRKKKNVWFSSPEEKKLCSFFYTAIWPQQETMEMCLTETNALSKESILKCHLYC